MIVALIDNGSLEPAAHRNLRALAAALAARTGIAVHAVSWKHSDRIPAELLDGRPAWTLRRFVAEHVARGERKFVFVPFFISAQGAIGSALRDDLGALQRTLGSFDVTFTDGLAARGVLPAIVAHRIRETMAEENLDRPAVILVDHGGPSAASAALRDAIARETQPLLGAAVRSLAAASMEGRHGPLLADQLDMPGGAGGDIVLAPLFLAPGRHAGPHGDLAQIARTAEDRFRTTAPPASQDGLRCHFTRLVGTHPLAADALAAGLQATLSLLHADSFA